jgi:superfamily I DNA and RNA helicase
MNLHSIPWHLIIPAAFKLLAKFGLIPGAALGYGAKKLFQKRRQNRASESWLSTEARIQYGIVKKEGPRQFWVELTYTYFVGEYRTGKHVHRFRKEDEAEQFLSQIKDKRLQARYNPAKPDESVLLDRDIEMVAMLAPARG